MTGAFARARAVGAFAAVVLRQVLRDRTSLFFMLVLPAAIITIIGSTFGGTQRLDLGVVRTTTATASATGSATGADAAVDDPVTARLVTALEAAEGVRVHRYDDLEEARRAVRRYVIAAAVVVDVDAGTVGLVAVPTDQAALTARTTVSGVVDRLNAEFGAAQVLTVAFGGDEDANRSLVEAAATAGVATEVAVSDVGPGRARTLSRFALTAPQNLVLFVFINSMASGAALVVARRSGILRRAAATPAGTATVLAGVGLGWFAIALVQSIVILLIGGVGFGVDWGDPLGATLLVVLFALVGSGAGLLVGAVGRNEDRTAAITPIVGMVLGALGGCMIPLDVFSPAMANVARGTPHYWALTAWQRLVFDGAGVGAIGVPLAVLGVVAGVLLGAAALLLRRELARG